MLGAWMLDARLLDVWLRTNIPRGQRKGLLGYDRASSMSAVYGFLVVEGNFAEKVRLGAGGLSGGFDLLVPRQCFLSFGVLRAVTFLDIGCGFHIFQFSVRPIRIDL